MNKNATAQLHIYSAFFVLAGFVLNRGVFLLFLAEKGMSVTEIALYQALFNIASENLIQDAIADDLRATILSVASLVRALFSAMFFFIFGHVLGLYPIQIALGIIGAIAIAITAVVSLKMVGMQVSKN